MYGDPYSRLLRLIRAESAEMTANGETALTGIGAGPAKLRLGKVMQQVPLKIAVAGIEQPTGVLRINERLVKGAKWKTKLTSSNSDHAALTGELNETAVGGQLHSGNTVIADATAEQLEVDLEVGDEVLLLTTDDQMFFIVMKVVNAE